MVRNEDPRSVPDSSTGEGSLPARLMFTAPEDLRSRRRLSRSQLMAEACERSPRPPGPTVGFTISWALDHGGLAFQAELSGALRNGLFVRLVANERL